jgi:hypothetical protein
MTLKHVVLILVAALLAACQTTPNLESETKYIRLARVVDVHVYTDEERREAARTERRESHTRVGLGVGFGFGIGSGGGGFGGVSIGMPIDVEGSRSRDLPPLVSRGANRYTVQPLGSQARLEINSYGKFKVGECVKLFSGHPTEYDRLFPMKPGESC